MDKDQEEQLQKYWEEYLKNEFATEDFFVDTPEELMEKQQAFANPICLNCSTETYSLITDGENNILSKCPKCKSTYKTHI
jgi:predicted Zn-ribbon and HTH transcriptional regulator